MGIPVLIIQGILESGKSFFIKNSIIRGDFGDLGKILILSQEEGEVEFDSEFCEKYGVSVDYLDSDEWHGKQINDVVRKHKPHVIFIEKNEMWGETFMPEYFDVQQVITVIDGTTFNTYFPSMRQLFFDMISRSELVVINRCDYTEETVKIKNSVKLINSNVEVIALDKNDNQIRLSMELPYSLDGDVIEIGLAHFGEFYVDSLENFERYENRIVEFECKALFSDELPPKTFYCARPALTCCVDDIQAIGHLCSYTERDKITPDSWNKITARVHYINFKNAQGKQVVLEFLSNEELDSPPFEDILVKLV